MSCLDRLIRIDSPCSANNNTCTDSYTISDMRGFSWKKSAKIASEVYEDAEDLLYNIRRKALNKFSADLSMYLQANGYKLDLIDRSFSSQKPNTTINGFLPFQVGYKRGIKLQQKKTCNHKKLHINSICILGNNTGNYTLEIYNGSVMYPIPVSLQANVKYCINKAQLCSLIGSELYATTDVMYFLIDGTNFNPAQITPNCGCGTESNICSFVSGYAGTLNTSGALVGNTNASNSFGIIVEANCECNFDEIICSLSNTNAPHIKQLLLYGCEIQFLETIIYSDRLNLFTVFGKDEAKELLEQVKIEYSQYFDVMIQSIGGLFCNSSFGDCIKCSGSSIKTNY